MIEEPPGRQDDGWPFYFALLVLLIVLAFVVSTADNKPSSRSREPGSERYNALLRGDANIRFALAAMPWESYRTKSAWAAVGEYNDAKPWPSAYRRIGIVRQVFLGRPGLDHLTSVDSPEAVEGLSPARRKCLQAESRMWREIYASKRLSPARADQLAARVRKLNLGPLRDVAAAEVYARAGDADTANALLRRARIPAMLRSGAILAMMSALLTGTLAGVFLIARFLARHAASLGVGPRPSALSGTAFAVFFQFLVLIVGFYLLAGTVSNSGVSDLAASIFGLVVAFVPVMLLFRSRSRQQGQDYREIGLRGFGIWQSLRWGIGAYCAAIPLLAISMAAALALNRVVFGGRPIEEHPIVPILMGGGAALWLSLVLGVVAAPIVEEIIFRGALYTALRSRLGTWGSALTSGAVFSALHPTMPDGFLPILTLGLVLALLREKTGSVFPCIVCHAVNNAMMLLLVVLAY